MSKNPPLPRVLGYAANYSLIKIDNREYRTVVSDHGQGMALAVSLPLLM